MPEHPHLVPTDMTSPVSSEAKPNGTMTDRAVESIARYAARNTCVSLLEEAATSSAM